MFQHQMVPQSQLSQLSPSSVSSLDNLNTSDLHTLQVALQQQQQNLQQQLKNILMLQQTSSSASPSKGSREEQNFKIKSSFEDVLLGRSPSKNGIMAVSNILSRPVTGSGDSGSPPPPMTSLSTSPFSTFTSTQRCLSPILIPGPASMMARLDLPAEENLDLEELEKFAKEFKQKRIKLGEDLITF